jgi:uncharacterized protein YabE (DUF348 family)
VNQAGIRVRLFAFVLAVGGLLAAYESTAAVVVVERDGESVPLRSHAATVEGVLHEAGVRAGPQDFVWPRADSPVEPGMLVRFRAAWELVVWDGTEIARQRSSATRPVEILSQSGIALFPGDRTWVDGIPIADPSQAQLPQARIRREASRELVANIGGTVVRLYSAAPTVAEALWDDGVDVRLGDQLSPGASDAFRDGQHAELKGHAEIAIEADGVVRRGWAGGETVGEALTASGVALVGMDYAEPAVTQPVPRGGRVRVVRVTEQLLTNLEPIAFESAFEPDPDTEIDRQSLIDPGAFGVAAEVTRIRLVDGEEVERVEEGRRVVREPEPRVIGYGTDITLRTLDTPDGPVQYWRAVSMYATAYSPCNLGVPGYCSEITSSGKVLQRGMVAFVLRWYRVMKGLPLYIPGYGFATVEDVGGGIPGRYWIDLGYRDDDIVSWNRWVTVYFLAPVPSPERIYWVLD